MRTRTPLFTGTAPALVTPFTLDGDIDFTALERLIDFQIDGGVEAIVVLGTTGENPTITVSERSQLVDAAIRHVDGRVPVIVGTGSNSTRDSIENARTAAAAGADGQLVVGPYYNKPTQEGFFAHVEAVASENDLPIIVYNVPGRTGSNMTADTVLRMAHEIDSVVAVKEASGNLSQVMDILRAAPDGFCVYSGDDELTLPMIAMGAHGVISVIGNALPQVFSEMTRRCLAGDWAAARRLHFELLPGMRACFVETNPIPVKFMLSELGLCGEHLRLPLLPLSESRRPEVSRALEQWMGVPA